jgi:hypothetical protein
MRAFVPNLDGHLAASAPALVRAGLIICMKLAAAGTSFLCHPLRNHFKQSLHVASSLEHYNAGLIPIIPLPPVRSRASCLDTRACTSNHEALIADIGDL